MQEATRAGQPYVNKRWLGGMLTNFVTIKKRIGLLDQLEARQQAGDFDRLPKKEAAKLTEELNKLNADARRHPQDEARPRRRSSSSTPTASGSPSPRRTSSRSRSSARATRTSTRTSSTTSSRPTTTRSARSGCSARWSRTPASRASRSAPRAPPSPSPRSQAAAEPEYDETASDELVAALAGGAALTFAPRRGRGRAAAGRPAARRAPCRAGRRGDPRGDRRRARPRGGREGRARKPTRPDARPPTRPADPPTSTDGADHRTPPARHRSTRTQMATITADAVKELRERTGAGMMDCKRALEETDGDLDKAVALLRERGLAAAAKKAGRDAREGLVSQLHPHRRPRRRADRGQLRDGLRRPHRRVPEARPRPRDPGRRAGAALRRRRPHPGGRARREEGGAAADETRPGEARGRSASRSSRASSRSGSRRSCLSSSRSATRSGPSRELVTEAIATIGENIRVRRFARYALGEEL